MRCLTFILSVILFCTSIPQVVHANGGGTGLPVNPRNSSGSNPTQNNWGIKVSVGPTTPIRDESIELLNGGSTTEELRQQYDAIININYTRMWDPGSWGLNFVKSPGKSLVMSDSVNGTIDTNITVQGLEIPNEVTDTTLNKLAWMCYLPSHSTSRPGETEAATDSGRVKVVL